MTVGTGDRTRLVVGVDGSPESKIALLWSAFLADAVGGTVEAISAWRPMSEYGWAGGGMAGMPLDWNPQASAEKALTETVDAVFGPHRPAGMTLTVREGGAAAVLLDASVGAHMLLVGSRGHGGFAGLLLGSTSSACAEHASCPVLVLHGSTPPPLGAPATGGLHSPATSDHS